MIDVTQPSFGVTVVSKDFGVSVTYGPVGRFSNGFGCATLKSDAAQLVRRFEEGTSFIFSLSANESYKILIPYEML